LNNASAQHQTSNMDRKNHCIFPALPPTVSRLINLTEGLWTEHPEIFGTCTTAKKLDAFGPFDTQEHRGTMPAQSAVPLLPLLQNRPSLQAVEMTMRVSAESSHSSKPDFRSMRSDMGSQASYPRLTACCGQSSSCPSGACDRPGSSWLGSVGQGSKSPLSVASQVACPLVAGSQGACSQDVCSQGACSWSSGPLQEVQQGPFERGFGSPPFLDGPSAMGIQESNDGSCSWDMTTQPFLQQDDGPFINDAAVTGAAVGMCPRWALVESHVGIAPPWAIIQAHRDDCSEESFSREPSGDEDDEIIIGPTQFAVPGSRFEEVWIPEGNKRYPVLSRPDRLCITDILRLSRLVKDSGAPLSFGSLLHICGHQQKCRPCMFERVPGRCRKLWLCDFCHSHVGRRHRSIQEAAQTPKPNSTGV